MAEKNMQVLFVVVLLAAVVQCSWGDDHVRKHGHKDDLKNMEISKEEAAEFKKGLSTFEKVLKSMPDENAHPKEWSNWMKKMFKDDPEMSKKVKKFEESMPNEKSSSKAWAEWITKIFKDEFPGEEPGIAISMDSYKKKPPQNEKEVAAFSKSEEKEKP